MLGAFLTPHHTQEEILIKAIKSIFCYFLNKHKILFLILCFIQIISIFASLFTLSFYTSSIELDKEYDASKTFTVVFNDEISNKNLIFNLDNFKNENQLSIKKISIQSDNEDCFLMFDCIYCPSNYKFGRYFTQSEFEDNKNVIITSKDVFPNVLVGDYVLVEGKKFKVIGTNDYIEYNILPLSALNKVKHFNSKLSITLNKYPDISEFNSTLRALRNCFDKGEVYAPDRVEDNIFNNYTVFIYIGVFLISIVNIAYVYRYILECNKKLIYIFRLNGASRIKCLIALLSVVLIFAIASFIVGCLISFFALPAVVNLINIDILRYNLEFKHYIFIFLTYIFIIMIVFIPFLKSCLKKISISNYDKGDN